MSRGNLIKVNPIWPAWVVSWLSSPLSKSFGPHPPMFYLPRGTILPNSTFLCAQAMRHTMGLHKPQATSEHDLHIKRFVSA